MKLRTQRQIINMLSAGFFVAGLCVVAWGFLTPSSPKKVRVDAGKRVSSTNQERDLYAGVRELNSMLGKKLQGPLNPIKRQPPPKVKPVVATPAKRWPAVSVDSIFTGTNSTLAVFSSNQESFTCGEGESFLGIEVKEISSNGVSLSFDGETSSKTVS